MLTRLPCGCVEQAGVCVRLCDRHNLNLFRSRVRVVLEQGLVPRSLAAACAGVHRHWVDQLVAEGRLVERRDVPTFGTVSLVDFASLRLGVRPQIHVRF